MRRLPIALTAVGLALASVPTAADAATLEQQGWWYRLRPAGLPTEAPARPDVAEGELLVEGSPEGPVAISAVRFRIDEGETNPVLTVRTVDQAGVPETTVVLACAADVRWNPAEGGAWDNRPYPDCTTSVEGSPSDDGTTWSFPVAALASGSALDVVLLPGKLANGPDPVSGSTFRLVLAEPALTTTPALGGGSGVPAPVGPSGPGTSSGSPAGSTFTSPASPTGPFTPPPAVSPSVGSATAPAGATTATGAVDGDTATPAPARVPVPASSATDERSRAIGFVILALAVAAAFAADRVPGLAGPAGGAGPDGERVGGLGRFARPRSEPPPRLL